MKSFFSVLLVTLPIFLWGQRSANPEKTYLSGKDFYSSGEFDMAAETFKQLTTYSNNYTEYATFFYALSSYYNAKEEIAKNILLQLTRKYPNWGNNHEAYYWLGKIYFEKGDYALALEQLSKIRKGVIDSEVLNLKLYHLSNASLDELKELYQRYPQDVQIGESLAKAMGQQPLSTQDLDQLQQIVKKFDLASEDITNQFLGQTVMKDRYNVAVCFPFLIDEVNDDPRSNSNQWVLELYQGIKLAHKDLSANNIDIELYAYDTERDSVKMEEILALDEMKNMDLLIGPLYPAPSKLAYTFAFDQKINILNPLSSNTEIISHNPYSFLFHPSDDTQASIAAGFVKDHIDKNKKSLIIYGSRQADSIAAFKYRDLLMELGMGVIMMDPIPTVDSEEVAKFISDNLYEIFTPLPGDDVLMTTAEDEDEQKQEEGIFVPRSDLAHVFVASTNELVVANVIGTLDNIGADISIMGNDRWLQSRYVDFQQLERLQVYMLAPGYLDYQSDNYKNFRKEYQRTFGSIPNSYSFIGYDLMLFFGKLLSQGGTYFQHELRKNDFYPGYLFQGYNYQQNNDNAHIPIVHFKDGVLKQAN